MEGWVNVDKYSAVSPDLIMDMESFPWPVPSDSVEEMLFSHVLEHVGQDTDTFLNIMKEIYRIGSNGCVVRVYVPHPRHDFFLIDPTHVRAILPETLEMFDKKKNLEWMARQSAKTPLGVFINVDFELVATELVPEPSVLGNQTRVDEKVLHTIRTQNNAIQEIKMTLRVRKDN